MNAQLIDPDVYDAILATLKTAPAVAQELGMDRTSLFRLAQSRGVGKMVGPIWLFTPWDVEILRANRMAGNGVVEPVQVHVTVTRGDVPKPRRRRRAEPPFA